MQGRVTHDGALSGRDQDAVVKTLNGLLKLIHSTTRFEASAMFKDVVKDLNISLDRRKGRSCAASSSRATGSSRSAASTI